MESRNIAVKYARGKVGKTQLHMLMQKKGEKKYCERMKSVVACEVLREHLESRVHQLSHGEKKGRKAASRCRETVIPPNVDDAEAEILELDELWSFIMKKTNQAWIWIALCRKTRQVVSYAIGD